MYKKEIPITPAPISKIGNIIDQLIHSHKPGLSKKFFAIFALLLIELKYYAIILSFAYQL